MTPYLVQLLDRTLITPLSKVAEKKMIPIYKWGDRSLVLNYKPISLITVVCKQMELIIALYPWKTWNKKDWLFKGQHGFSPGHSCESQVMTACQDTID
jgi:hypothetical protein